MDIESFVVYNVVLAISLVLAIASNLINLEKINFFDILLIVFLVLVFGFRDSVGNDYQNYVDYFNLFRFKEAVPIEFFFVFLMKLFKPFLYGHVYWFASSSLLSFSLLIVLFKRLKILSVGVITIFLSQFVFLLNDQVRQGLAIILFLWALVLFEKKGFWPYLLLMLITGLFFHNSAFFVIPIVLLDKVKIRNWMLVSIPIGALLIWKMKLLNIIFYFTLLITPVYGEYFLSRSRYLEADELSTGLGVLFWVVFGLLFLFYFRKESAETIYYKVWFFGLIFHLLTIDFHLFNRINAYLFYLSMLVIPLGYNFVLKRRVWATIILGYFLFFCLSILTNSGKHGGFPFRNIILDYF